MSNRRQGDLNKTCVPSPVFELKLVKPNRHDALVVSPMKPELHFLAQVQTLYSF